MCGDLAKNAKADEVYIFRDTADAKKIKKINLTDAGFMKSSWSVLKPNDVVYIKRDMRQEYYEDDQRRRQLNISMVTSLVSVIVLLITILKR